jgi:hypothetical protein
MGRLARDEDARCAGTVYAALIFFPQPVFGFWKATKDRENTRAHT